MALVPMKELLLCARQGEYAVGQFNTTDLDFLDAILCTAVRKRSPVILGVAEVHFEHMNLELLAHVIHQAAVTAPIPVAVNLDHGKTLEGIMRGVRGGFTSVMFDGSMLPYEENVAKTSDIVKIARSVGVSVEGEVGHVGGGEGALAPTAAAEEFFTDPQQAADFVGRTQVDCLGVSVGNVHGLYKGEPKLDFERIARISELTQIPLALHGGSGIPDVDFRRAIQEGISKVNIYTAIQVNARNKMLEVFAEMKEMTTYIDLMDAARGGVGEEVSHKIDVFGSGGFCEEPNPLCERCRGCECAGGEAISDEALVNLVTESVLRVLRERGT